MITTIYELVSGGSYVPHYKFCHGPLRSEIPFLVHYRRPIFLQIAEYEECGRVLQMNEAVTVEGFRAKTALSQFKDYPIAWGMIYDKAAGIHRPVEMGFLCDRAGVFIFADKGIRLVEGAPLKKSWWSKG